MTKIIPAKEEVEIVSCIECDECEYDPDYGRSYDSGYDCLHDGTEHMRIADDWEITSWNKEKKEAERLPLFPLEFSKPHPLDIPSWCPLKNKGEE